MPKRQRSHRFKSSKANINNNRSLLLASPKQARVRARRTETTLTTKSNEAARARAESSFRKEERAKEGARAMMEYQANARMIREKTERLKALRLAKEAADRKRVG